jgi:hypothetical protein
MLATRGWTVAILLASAVAAHAEKPLPEWVVQAAAAQTPAYAPDTKAVVLLEDKLITFQANGRPVERYRGVVKILRPTGRDYAFPMVWFNKDQKLNSFHVWSIGPDGHQYTVKDEEVRERGVGADWMVYSDVRMKFASPPGADPNGVVAFEYEKQLAPYATEQSWDFQNPVPTLDSVFEVDLPPGWKYYAAWANHEAAAPAEATPSHMRWELRNIDAVDTDHVPLAPAENALAGRMVVHYASTDLPAGDERWAQIGSWYENLSSSRTEGSNDVAGKAREIAAGETDYMTRLEKVTRFMQGEIRYVAIEVGIGGLQPHAASDVFHNRYGDCKDKATLLISMLDAVGIRATWVLVDTDRGFVNPGVPSISGNHMISAIEIPPGYDNPKLQAVVKAKNGKRYLIFDPTDELTPVGLLGGSLQGGYGVLVAGKDSQVIELPMSRPDADLTERNAKFELADDGTLKGSVTEMRSGLAAKPVRRVYVQEDAKAQREFMERRLRRDFSSFTLDSSAVKNASELNKQVVLEYSVTASRYAKNAGNLLLVRPRVLGSHSFALDDRPRKYPIDLEQTGIWRDSYDVKLPAGYVVDELPDPVSVDVGFATYHSEVKVNGDDLHYTREYVVKDLDLKPEKYADLKKLMAAISTDEASSAVLKKKD